jgi:ferredoxin
MVYTMGSRNLKASVRYFSGTGNSWHIASVCAERLKAAGYETDLHSVVSGRPPDPAAERSCFCFPVHALDLPRIVPPYLRDIPPTGKQMPAMLLVTGGDPDNCGWALESGSRLLDERGYRVRIADLVPMPNNWTPFHSAPGRDEAERMIDQGRELAEDRIRRFLAGESWIKPIVLRKFGPAGSIAIRTLFHARGVYKLWIFFKAAASCNGCGLCARICPTGSIRLKSGKPVWSARCVQCMRCYNFCPNRAIRQLEFLLHGSRHGTYRLPGFHPAPDI